MGSMKVHQFARGLIWPEHEVVPSLTLGVCKGLRPLAPKVPNTTTDSLISATAPTNNNHLINLSRTPPPPPPPPPAFDLKSFIRSDHSTTIKLASTSDINRDTAQVQETHPGGTRWNPTQEQIGILEMLYRGGMRTPNAQQIEQITAQLGKYGKIEGKNVFYWFQNHKARERQKQKRSNLGLTHSPRTPSAAAATTNTLMTSPLNPREILLVGREGGESAYKRKCRSWSFESLEDDNNKMSCCNNEEAAAAAGNNKTLELFPLHPEGILSRST